MPRDETAVKKLMEAADKDPALKAKLFKDPQAVAKQYDFSFTEAEVSQLKKVARLTDLIDDYTAGRIVGPGPVFYPLDIWWKGALRDHILRYRPIYYPMFHHMYYPIGPSFYPWHGPIFYPAPPIVNRAQNIVRR